MPFVTPYYPPLLSIQKRSLFINVVICSTLSPERYCLTLPVPSVCHIPYLQSWRLHYLRSLDCQHNVFCHKVKHLCERAMNYLSFFMVLISWVCRANFSTICWISQIPGLIHCNTLSQQFIWFESAQKTLFSALCSFNLELPQVFAMVEDSILSLHRVQRRFQVMHTAFSWR